MSDTGYTPKTHGRCTFCPNAVTHVVRTPDGAYRVCTECVDKIGGTKIVTELNNNEGSNKR